MVEVVKGMWNTILSLGAGGSILRTIVYTLGHLAIAVTCVMLITGAHVHQALADAFIEPVLNSIWFFVLDRLWTRTYVKH